MNSFNISGIKKNTNNKVQTVDNQAKLDLEKIFNTAMDTVDDYQDEDVAGSQIRRSASSWAEKINDTLDELPANHPLRKSGKIQKLVSKLDSIVNKPDSEVTYDVMVAGGKPPALSKRRFWQPIANLLNDAMADVVKPLPQTETEPYVAPAPKHAVVREGVIVKNKPVTENIPVKPKRQIIKAPASPQVNQEQALNTRRQQVVHESGAKPGFVTNKVMSYARDRAEFINEVLQNITKIKNDVSMAVSIAASVEKDIKSDLKDIDMLFLNLKPFDPDNPKESDDQVRQRKDTIKKISELYGDVFQNIIKIQGPLNDAEGNTEDLAHIIGSKPYGATWIEDILNLNSYVNNAVDLFSAANLNGLEKTPGNPDKENNFIRHAEEFVSLFYDKQNFNHMMDELNLAVDSYESFISAYLDLRSIDSNKTVYNDFMAILKDKTDSDSIRRAVETYAQSRIGKI